jgi:ADP-heptose:LPS heptosyltransferase
MKARRILIVQLGRVGDLILMSPMVRELKRANAGHEIHLLGSPYNVELARHYPYFDTVHLFRRNPFQLARLIIALRREAFDVWMDVKDHFSKLGSLMALTSNAKSKIGYNARLEVFNHAILPDSAQRDVHAVDRYLKTLSHFDIDIRHASRRPAVFVDKDSEQRFEGFCERRQLFGYCCVNVSAASKHRYWHVKKWNELFAFLSDRGKPIVIISAPNDRYFANGLAGRYSNAFSL